VDLPGLVGVEAEGEKGVKEDTKNLLKTMIDKYKGRAIFIAIRKATTDLRQGGSFMTMLDIIKEKQIAAQTIGVITKCDELVQTPRSLTRQICERLEAMLGQEDLKEAKYDKFGYGCVLTSNKPPTIKKDGFNESKSDLSEENLLELPSNEQRYFEETELLTKLGEGSVTCKTLIKRISERYLQFIHETWIHKTLSSIFKMRYIELKRNIDLGVPSTDPQSQLDATYLLDNLPDAKTFTFESDEVKENAIVPAFNPSELSSKAVPLTIKILKNRKEEFINSIAAVDLDSLLKECSKNMDDVTTKNISFYKITELLTTNKSQKSGLIYRLLDLFRKTIDQVEKKIMWF